MNSGRTLALVVGLTLALLAVGVWYSHGRADGTATTDPHKIAVVSAVYGGSATEKAIIAALGSVAVVDSRPDPSGYDRDCGTGDGCSFGQDWSDATDAPDGHNGCDTRNDVLREQLVGVRVEPGTYNCKVAAGTLVDPYTGRTVDFASEHYDIQIDHVVPLAYAWDMGAAGWTQQQRSDFANDTRLELLASWGPANEEKSDAGPAEWLPEDTTFRCDYVLRFLQVAIHYGLSVTTADAQAAHEATRLC